LPVTTAEGISALVAHRVGVGEPRHHLAVGADVRRRDVAVGPDGVHDGVAEAAGDALQLTHAQLARVALHAALAAAEGDAHQRTLDGHEQGEALDIIEVYIGVVAQAALVGAQGVVMLDAVSLEQTVVAVVHADGEVHHQLVLGLGEDHLHAVAQLEHIRRAEHRLDGLCVEVVGILGEAKLVEHGVALDELRSWGDGGHFSRVPWARAPGAGGGGGRADAFLGRTLLYGLLWAKKENGERLDSRRQPR
jgi:hypothetical protein